MSESPPNRPEEQGSNRPSAPLPPLAKGCPFFGNTFQFLENTTTLLRRSHDELGPVFRLRALWLKYSVISGFPARKFLKEHQDDVYLSRKAVFEKVGQQLGDSPVILGLSGESHQRLRRVLHTVYSREVASGHVPQLIAIVRQHVRDWREGSTHEVMDLAERLGFEMYSQIVCGRSLAKNYDDILRIMNWNMNIGGRIWPFWFYRMPWYQGSRRRLLELMWGLVRERRKTGIPSGDPPTILDTIFAVRDDLGESFNDDAAVSYASYGFAGSCCYMSRLIGFLLYEILSRPELRQELTAEVDAHFGQGVHDAADLRQMKLLRATYLENLRYHPVSQGMPFLCERDFVVEGKQIQRGDLVVLSQVPMAFSETPFKNPDTFDPARCLPPRNEHGKNDAFHPFGIAHRTCAAMGMVETMAMTLVATLLHELRLEKSPPDYRLKIKVKPLPGPDSQFRLKVLGHRIDTDRQPTDGWRNEDQILAEFSGAEHPDVRRLLDQAVRREFAENETIIAEGDIADAFYVIVRGEVRVSRAAGGELDSQVLARLTVQHYFGEIGLIQNAKRNATVRGGPGGVEVLVLSRETFLELLATNDFVSDELVRVVNKRLVADALMAALPKFRAGNATQALPYFDQLQAVPDEVLIREGEPADRFFILIEGEVRVTQRDAGGEDRPVATLHSGEYFGEVGLLEARPRMATVRVVSPLGAKLLVTTQVGFEKLINESGGPRGDLARAMHSRITGYAADTARG